MYLDGVINRLNSKLRVTQDGAKHTKRLGEGLRTRLIGEVPVATGNLASKMLRTWGPERRVGNAWVMGLGDGKAMGNPGRAPRGTIKKFLEEHPQYKQRAKSGHFRASQAWWALSGKAKIALQEYRQAGLYGGGYQGIGSGKAAYFYPQEGSLDQWQESAAAAGITPQFFVSRALMYWRQADVPEAMRAFHEEIRQA